MSIHASVGGKAVVFYPGQFGRISRNDQHTVFTFGCGNSIFRLSFLEIYKIMQYKASHCITVHPSKK